MGPGAEFEYLCEKEIECRKPPKPMSVLARMGRIRGAGCGFEVA